MKFAFFFWWYKFFFFPDGITALEFSSNNRNIWLTLLRCSFIIRLSGRHFSAASIALSSKFLTAQQNQLHQSDFHLNLTAPGKSIRNCFIFSIFILMIKSIVGIPVIFTCLWFVRISRLLFFTNHTRVLCLHFQDILQYIAYDVFHHELNSGFCHTLSLIPDIAVQLNRFVQSELSAPQSSSSWTL